MEGHGTAAPADEKMQDASDKMEYEKAAQYRDSLLSLNKLEESQKATTESGGP